MRVVSGVISSTRPTTLRAGWVLTHVKTSIKQLPEKLLDNPWLRLIRACALLPVAVYCMFVLGTFLRPLTRGARTPATVARGRGLERLARRGPWRTGDVPVRGDCSSRCPSPHGLLTRTTLATWHVTLSMLDARSRLSWRSRG